MDYNKLAAGIAFISLSIYSGFIPLLILKISFLDWEEPNWKFILKKILDCVTNIYPFTLIVFENAVISHFFQKDIFRNPCIVIITLLSILPNIAKSLSTLSKMTNWNSISNSKIAYTFMLISIYTNIFFLFATLNYWLYCIYPDGYKINCELNFGEIAFEFIYMGIGLTQQGTRCSDSA